MKVGLKSLMGKKNGMMNLLIIIGLLFVVFALFSYNQSKTWISDTMANVGSVAPQEKSPSLYGEDDMMPQMSNQPQPHSGMKSIQVQPEDLLPTDNNSEWQDIAPSGGLSGQNLIDPNALIGINSLDNTDKRNANLSLRSDPPIPRGNPSIWNQSTIMPDPYRRPLE